MHLRRHQQLFSLGGKSSQNKEGIKLPPMGQLKLSVYFGQIVHTVFFYLLYPRSVLGRNFSFGSKISKLWHKTQGKTGKYLLQIKYTGKASATQTPCTPSSASAQLVKIHAVQTSTAHSLWHNSFSYMIQKEAESLSAP